MRVILKGKQKKSKKESRGIQKLRRKQKFITKGGKGKLEKK